MTVPDLIEHSGVRGTADPPSAGQPILNSEISRNWEDGRQDRMCNGFRDWINNNTSVIVKHHLLSSDMSSGEHPLRVGT